MNRNQRVETANQTLKIIETGQYEFASQYINIQQDIENCINHSKTIHIEDWDKILIEFERRNQYLNNQTTIKVLNCSSIEALTHTTKGLKVGVLNFASAKNPGGGFLGGASAQEESLARSSSLYASQIKDMTMYQYNRNQSTFLYSDYMIYSPEVLFWFDDFGNTLQTPLKADVITSPAPNKGAMLQHNRRDEIAKIGRVFQDRIEKVLALAVQNGIESLILGAWGCGVFRNEPSDIAHYFKEVIMTKFKHSFKEIIYAIYDTSEKQVNFKAFLEAKK
jgi:uncharacterized protein (TIGR02452 family)